MPKRQKKSIQKNLNTKTFPKDSSLYNYGLIFLFSLFLILFTTFKITGDDDIFWHLATGKYIAEHHEIPSTDIFSFSNEGQKWIPFEWGWDVLNYEIYIVGGFAALSVFRTIIFLLIFFTLFTILKKFKISITLIFLFFIILSFGMMDRLAIRPHIISYLFLTLLLFIITEFKYFSRNNYKILFFIPLIFLFWANMHMGIMAGLFLFGIFLLTETIIFLKPDFFSSKEIPALMKKDLIRLIFIFIVSIITILINPNTYETYIYTLGYSKLKMLETINEWKSPFDDMFTGRLVILIYKLFLFGGIVILYYSYKKKDLFASLVFTGFAIYSLNAVRFTVDFMIVTIVFFVLAVNFIIKNFKSEKLDRFFEFNPVPKFILAGSLLFFISTIPNDKLYLEYMKYFKQTGFGIDSDFIPTQLMDFMKENKINSTGERPFNHYMTGGVLVWNFPESKNFIDSRYVNEETYNEYQSIFQKKPGYENKFAKYDFDYVIYFSPDLVNYPQEMEKTIISYLSKHSDEWKLVFWDDKSFLFLKNAPKFKDIIDRYEYKYVSPYNFINQKSILEKGLSEDASRVKEELNRKLSEENITEANKGNFTRLINSAYSNKLLKVK